VLGGAVAQRVAAQMGHGLAGQFALTADLQAWTKVVVLAVV
jgi:hypothetical protein